MKGNRRSRHFTSIVVYVSHYKTLSYLIITIHDFLHEWCVIYKLFVKILLLIVVIILENLVLLKTKGYVSPLTFLSLLTMKRFFLRTLGHCPDIF